MGLPAVRNLVPKRFTRKHLVIAAVVGQVLPVPVAYQCVIAVCPFTAGFKIFQHFFFGGAEGYVWFGHLAHAYKDNQAFKQTEQIINVNGILLRTVGKLLIKRIIGVNNPVILCVVFPKGQKASTKNILKGPVVLLCCLSTNLLYSV